MTSKEITAPDFDYTISIQTRDGEESIEIIAAAVNLDVAAAAFEQAIKSYPKQRIALRQGSTTLRERLQPGQNELGTDFS